MVKDIIFLGLWFVFLAYLVLGCLIDNGVITFSRYYARKARRIIEKDIKKYKSCTR